MWLASLAPPRCEATRSVPSIAAAGATNSFATVSGALVDRMPKGAVLVVAMHYTANGKDTTDRTRIGVRYAPEAPKTELRVGNLQNANFVLPAGALVAALFHRERKKRSGVSAGDAGLDHLGTSDFTRDGR